MITNGSDKPGFASQITKILDEEPGLSVKELAERLKTNRQFMAGVLRVLWIAGKVIYPSLRI